MKLSELYCIDLFQLMKSQYSSEGRRAVMYFPSALRCVIMQTSSNVFFIPHSFLNNGVTSTCCMTLISWYRNHLRGWGTGAVSATLGIHFLLVNKPSLLLCLMQSWSTKLHKFRTGLSVHDVHVENFCIKIPQIHAAILYSIRMRLILVTFRENPVSFFNAKLSKSDTNCTFIFIMLTFEWYPSSHPTLCRVAKCFPQNVKIFL